MAELILNGDKKRRICMAFSAAGREYHPPLHEPQCVLHTGGRAGCDHCAGRRRIRRGAQMPVSSEGGSEPSHRLPRRQALGRVLSGHNTFMLTRPRAAAHSHYPQCAIEQGNQGQGLKHVISARDPLCGRSGDGDP